MRVPARPAGADLRAQRIQFAARLEQLVRERQRGEDGTLVGLQQRPARMISDSVRSTYAAHSFVYSGLACARMLYSSPAISTVTRCFSGGPGSPLLLHELKACQHPLHGGLRLPAAHAATRSAAPACGLVSASATGRAAGGHPAPASPVHARAPPPPRALRHASCASSSRRTVSSRRSSSGGPCLCLTHAAHSHLLVQSRSTPATAASTSASVSVRSAARNRNR
jgi:hypothetical protein